MLIFQSIILGLTQGLSEFIPISSSAHLIIIPWLFGWTDPAVTGLTFDVALHIGTLAAVVVFFRRDWARYILAGVKSIIERRIGGDQDRKMAWFLVLACIPGGFAGVFLEDKIQASYHQLPIGTTALLVMAAVIAAFGGLMWAVDHFVVRKRKLEQLTAKDALIIGLAQALAIFPGVSRSGSTITAGMALGLERSAAARFSFLLSTPIIAGAGLKSLAELLASLNAGTISSTELMIFPIGVVVAAISGFLCIRLLLDFLQKHSVRTFTFYRWGLAVLVLIVALVRG